MVPATADLHTWPCNWVTRMRITRMGTRPVTELSARAQSVIHNIASCHECTMIIAIEHHKQTNMQDNIILFTVNIFVLIFIYKCRIQC